MKTTFRLFILILLSLSYIQASAQLYRVESLVSDVIFTKDKPANFIDRSNEKGYRIPNGTEIKVLSRVVKDTTSSRGVLAEIEYKDKHYYTEARWLVFSENNEEGVEDIFANDDLSTSTSEFMGFSIKKLTPHSSWGRFLYSYIPPAISAGLLLIAIILLLLSPKLFLPGLCFILSAAIQIYLSAMLDWDVYWWCNPNYQGLKLSILRVILLGLYLLMQFLSIVFFYGSGDDNLKVWPIVTGYLLTFPAGMLSASLTGYFWIGAALCYLIPLFINFIRSGFKGAVITIFFFIAINIIFGTFISALQVSLWILGGLIIACPALLYLISLTISPILENLKSDGVEYGWTASGRRFIIRRKKEDGFHNYS